MQIYSCFHKPYQQVKSEIIIPIHVGKALSNQNLGFVCDNTGDNISEKNPYPYLLDKKKKGYSPSWKVTLEPYSITS